MEGLVIFILLAIASGISNYFQKKRQGQPPQGASPPRPRPQQPRGETSVPHWPASARDWQEELRRMLQGESVPPPRIPPQASTTTAPPVRPPPGRVKPVLPTSPVPVLDPSEGDLTFPNPLKQSTSAYTRASQIAEQVESRMELVDQQTMGRHPSALLRSAPPSAAFVARRLTRNRESLREAFIATLIFGPPLALSNSEPPTGNVPFAS